MGFFQKLFGVNKQQYSSTPKEIKSNVNNDKKIKQKEAIRQNDHQDFNPLVKVTKTDNKPLTSLEISFLDYISSKNVSKLTLPAYWSLEYNIDSSYLISKLLNNGYLTITSSVDNLSRLKVDELRQILKLHSLKTTGKKEELIERLNISLSKTQLVSSLSGNENKFYTLTSQGIKLVNNNPRSITKDLKFENDCLSFISKKEFDNAYLLICDFEITKKTPRGLGINWADEKINGLSRKKKHVYKHLMSKISSDIPNECHLNLVSSFILCNMLGRNYFDTSILFNRLTDEKYKTDSISYVEDLWYQYLIISNEYEINENKKEDILTNYQIVNNKKENLCVECEKHFEKQYEYKFAKVGINYPPFHKKCTCLASPIIKK